MLRDVLTGLFLLVVVAALVGFLWAVVRSIIAERQLRGWKDRLDQPCLEEIDAKWGVRLPRVLEEFYQTGAAERSEFYLVAPGADRGPRWFVMGFIPLMVRDIGEWMSGMVPGIPIALDGNKGFYYLPFEALRGVGLCPVLHRNLGGRWPFMDTVVAPSVEAFVQFQAVEPGDEDGDNRRDEP